MRSSLRATVMAYLVNPVLRILLRTRTHRALSRSVALLDYTGRRSGRRHALPAMYAAAGDSLIVAAGRHRTKTWWRNVDVEPQQVAVLLKGQSVPALVGRLEGEDRQRALARYRARFRRADLEPDPAMLVLTPR